LELPHVVQHWPLLYVEVLADLVAPSTIVTGAGFWAEPELTSKVFSCFPLSGNSLSIQRKM
jgi:hypothetical protein